MHPFSFVERPSAEEATKSVATADNAMFFAGGTTLIDLMKLEVMTPAELVDINRLPFSEIEVTDAGVMIGANVRNSDLAHHKHIRENYPVLSEALLAGASAQLRNMATTAGNIMQKTRCEYFRDVHTKCNKRQPGSGCDALTGVNRHHALFGASDRCIATNPSDMCMGMVVLDATVHTLKQDGTKRSIAFEDFHLVPGNTPDRETVLERGELITHVELKKSKAAAHSHYLKVRDRASYEFALTSSAVAIEINGDTMGEVRVGLGGVATKPWRAKQAESALTGKKPSTELFRSAAEAALAGAKPLEHNAFKVELAKRTLVYALEELMERSK